jgi:rRNA maturation RNase YbeY
LIKNLQVYSSDNSIKKKEVHTLISSLREELNFTLNSFSISFISSKELLQINRKYLKHDYMTDIITFNYSGHSNVLDGEILISTEDASNNAKKYKVSYSNELSRLVIHGILHLSGFDDKKKKDKNIMKLMENKLLNKFKFILLAGR